MILEAETVIKYGYLAMDLKPKSHKSIVTTCDSCKKIRTTSKADYHALCISCALKGRHPNYKGGKIKRICKECNKDFDVWRSILKRGGGVYCSISCATRGANHPQWKDGISFEPYCIKFNESYKREIRDLFGNKCFLCDKTEDDNGRALDVHHVNYNKDCGCDGEKCICVPLCKSCHAKTGADRDYWQCLIMEMLKPIEAWSD